MQGISFFRQSEKDSSNEKWYPEPSFSLTVEHEKLLVTALPKRSVYTPNKIIVSQFAYNVD